MTGPSDDSWAAGDAYEAYMGRWSRALARVFLEWLHPAATAHFLEVGCGTGALTSAIVDLGRPASVVACDTSASFIEHAQRGAADGVTFQAIPSADALPSRDGGFDVIVSGLVLNFVPDPMSILKLMRERARPGGTVAAYVWDYTGGMELLKYFWEEAVRLNPAAASLDEARRFWSWNEGWMASLFRDAGLTALETSVLEIPTEFSNFEDYWQPFLGRSGPAPSYVASLDQTERALLREALERRLATGAGGRIRLRARGLAVRGTSS